MNQNKPKTKRKQPQSVNTNQQRENVIFHVHHFKEQGKEPLFGSITVVAVIIVRGTVMSSGASPYYTVAKEHGARHQGIQQLRGRWESKPTEKPRKKPDLIGNKHPNHSLAKPANPNNRGSRATWWKESRSIADLKMKIGGIPIS